MPYGSIVEVRKLAGITNDTTWSDPTILGYMSMADNQVNIYTRRGSIGWVPSDFQYPTVVDASNHFAASRIIRTYPQRMGEADMKYDLAKEMCNKIVELSTGGLDLGIIVTQNKHKTHPLNREGEVHLSSKKGKLVIHPSETDIYTVV